MRALTNSSQTLAHKRDGVDTGSDTSPPTTMGRQPAIVKHTDNQGGKETGARSQANPRAKRHLQEPQRGINEPFEKFQERHFKARGGRGPVPADEGRTPPKSAMDAFIEIAFSFATLPGIEPMGVVTPGGRPIELPSARSPAAKSPSAMADAFPEPPGKLNSGDGFWGFLSKKSPAKAQELALKKSSSTSVEYKTGIKDARGNEITKTNVYRGYVFRGDMRGPQEVFKDGFKLRTPVESFEEISGHRGGFGGGHDALDPDGRGISTSAYYDKDKAGAFYYGGAKGGTTYLIDGRQMVGFDLYANNNLARNPGSTLKLPPLEINYGQDIPGNQIVGAFDAQGKFTANPGYKPSQKPIPFVLNSTGS